MPSASDAGAASDCVLEFANVAMPLGVGLVTQDPV